MATPGRDVKLDVKRIESNRNFMNKIWNASRFVFMNREDVKPDANIVPKNDVNRWILSELDTCAKEVSKAFEEYRFNEAANTLYSFIWGTYCDWYVEASKVSLYKGDAADKHETQVVMLTALDGWLRLLHPIAPFITESLFQELHGEDARLVTDAWRTEFASDAGAKARMQRIMDIVNAIRSIRGEMNVSPGKKVDAHFAVSDALKAELEPQAKVLTSLAKLESITWVAADAEVENAAIAPLTELKIFLPLAGLVNVAEELTRVTKNMEKLEKEMAGLSGRLNNAKFVDSAPEAVVIKARADLAGLEAKLAELEASKVKLEAL